MYLRSICSSVVCAMALLLSVSTAQAGFIVLTDGGGTNATGILDLNIDGTLYNVDFVVGNAEQVYGGLPPVFNFNAGDEALAAVNAVNAALDSVPTVETVGPVGFDFFVVGFEWDIPFVTIQGSSYLPISNVWASTGISVIRDDDNSSWAVFAVVPTPGAMCVFGFAFLLQGGRRRKTRT